VGAIGETLSNKTTAVTVNSVDLAFVSPNRYSQPDAGKHFIVVDLTIEAIGTERVNYNPLDFEVADADSYRYRREGVVGADPALSYGDLNPGEKIRGLVPFQIPDTATGLQLLYAPSLGRVIARWDLTPVEAKATPEATQENTALAMAISGCQEGMRVGMESIFSQYPALQGVRGEILQIMDNLCSRVVTLICEGASDEEITTAVGDACLQVKSLSEQVGLPYSAETCKDAMSRSMLDDRASIAAACSP
jgi:bacterioferritin-associated ferredoxin